jgi:hypothetical protein
MAEFSKAPSERRKEPRVRVTLQARYMLPDRREYLCTVVDASAGALALAGPERGAMGANIVLYIDNIGRVEGTVVRHFEDGFVVKFKGATRAAQAIAKLVDRQRGAN